MSEWAVKGQDEWYRDNNLFITVSSKGLFEADFFISGKPFSSKHEGLATREGKGAPRMCPMQQYRLALKAAGCKPPKQSGFSKLFLKSGGKSNEKKNDDSILCDHADGGAGRGLW